MPIHLEFINVIVRRDAVDAKFPGGWEAFLKKFGASEASWHDDYLFREGAMNEMDAERLVEMFAKEGLTPYRTLPSGEVEWVDLCVMSMLGFNGICDWLDMRFPLKTMNLRAIRFLGDESTDVVRPDWYKEPDLPPHVPPIKPSPELPKSIWEKIRAFLR